ncbi:glycosyltransferase [Chromatiaceae bacterium AAb-1]|nr:glycosyltransferase [Chromatiaceae bacterium AAb-1]
MTYRSSFFSVHTIDPLGNKVGGIETHIRQVIKYCPEEMRLILIGVDDSGKLPLGQLQSITLYGRPVLFMPIMHSDTSQANSAAKSLFQSVTLRFFLSFLRYSGKIRKLAAEMPYSFDIQRYEFAWLCRLFGFRYVLTTHGDADPNQPMDSLLRRYWFAHRFNEKHAVRGARHIYSVNQQQTARIQKDYPQAAAKTEFMTVSVDDQLFQASPYLQSAGPLKIAFVGRLDTFKRPGMMFRVIAELAARTGNQVEFHYVGAADPTVFPEFTAIAALTTRHGFKTSAQVAVLWQEFHMGIVTSVFEGMPVYVLEALCAGRPVCSVHLPQLKLVIEDGVSGILLEQNNDSEALVQALADAMLSLWHKMQQGEITPEAVSSRVDKFKASNQMEVLFNRHRQVQQSGT